MDSDGVGEASQKPFVLVVRLHEEVKIFFRLKMENETDVKLFYTRNQTQGTVHLHRVKLSVDKMASE